MKKYIVRIKEILSQDIELEAQNEEEAKKIVEDMYKRQEIVFDYMNFDHIESDVIK